MSAPYSYIAVEGLIGAGKTTLAKRLAADRGGRLVLEEFDDNPFLPRFYEDPERFGFSVELSFLAQRYHQLKRVTEQEALRGMHGGRLFHWKIGRIRQCDLATG